MNNKKVFTNIGIVVIVIVIVIIIITAMIGIFSWKNKKKDSANLNPQTLLQSNKSDDSKKETVFEVSDNWTLISHYNFWSNPNIFKQHPYNFPNIEFYYPENWEFRCCGDMDHVSEHFINPPSRDKSLPYIRIMDYILSGCPTFKNDCAIDETIKLTASEKFNRLISAISTADVLPKKKLENLNISAFVYKKTEKNGNFSKGYIINIGSDVMEVDFVNYELLDDTFIENFLNRISFEIK